jgi:hypothetical protein
MLEKILGKQFPRSLYLRAKKIVRDQQDQCCRNVCIGLGRLCMHAFILKNKGSSKEFE